MTGSSARRLEDEPLLTGRGVFVGDLIGDETLHCVFVRSPVAHGRLTEIGLDQASTMPGVVLVATGSTLRLTDLPPSPGRGAPPAEGMGQPALARERVRFAGEPVAVVVAESAQQAADAADAVWVDYEMLPVVSGVEASISNETLLFPEAGTNLVHRDRYESSGFNRSGESAVTVSVDIPRVAPVTIEPMSILASPRTDGLTVWCGHQSMGRLHSELAGLLDVDPASIRVIVPDVGGAFGAKGAFYPEYLVVASLALRLQREVVWVQRRREQFASGTHGRGQSIRVELTGDPSGRLHSAELRISAEIGAYPNTGSRVPLFTKHVAQGPYDIPHLAVETVVAVTNRAPTGPYRGAGRPEAAIAMERAIDAFAVEIDVPPEEVRRINYIRPDSLPFTAHSGALYDSGDYEAALDLALETARVGDWRAEQARRIQTGANPIGIGIGAFIERAGGSVGSGEYGRVEIRPDGSVVVRTGSTAAGQGHRTVWSRIAADVFGIAPGDVTFFAGDTDEVSAGVGSFGSRSAQVGASAIALTAQRVADEARDLAAEMLEAAAADIEVADGHFRVVGSPGSELSLADVAAYAGSKGLELASEEMFNPNAQTFPYGAYVAVVEIDLETGEVRLLTLTAVDDCGNVLDPMIVEGQLHGSIMQGLGTSLLESVEYDADGNLLTANLTSYLIPDAALSFHLESRRLVHPAPSNPLGVKGTGEAGCIGVPPAMLNAAHDALRHLGVTSLDLPLTPGRVWEAIETARRAARPA